MGFQRLTLFVADAAARRGPLCARVERACEELGPESVRLEIVDVGAHPERARGEGVHLTPTLQAGAPGEDRRVFGDLTDVREALWMLGVGA
jgi:hypothetical protein